MEDDSHPLRRAFVPLIGLPAWFVHQGYGSFLTLEFGAPHLRVREPRAARGNVSEKVKKLFLKRRVSVKGEWHLWIYCCQWRVSDDGQEIAWSDSPDRKIAAA